MKIIHVIAAAAVLSLPVAVVSAPAMAASAHNSQLGAGGNTTNSAGPSGMVKRQKQMKRRMKGM
ncbi:hypothetical protein [Lichenibacterium dinghuense]|uniref:hypothetical protein n=1 Tax=Lichenibacterium dinghuense TaxID=2895977 RepID=UPI001F2D0B1E|nr:hypothetical protein [Lichenibacterium sp. 6Y81]